MTHLRDSVTLKRRESSRRGVKTLFVFSNSRFLIFFLFLGTLFLMSTLIEVTSSSKTKRPSSSGSDSDDKRQKTSHNLPEKPASDDRKPLFQRVFSEEDEIYLLNAFLDIGKTADGTPAPATSSAALIFDRVRNSLSGEVTQTQLIEKLRKLRQKYSKQVNKKSIIKNPHERDVFEVSQKIWGDDLAQPRNSSSSATKDPQSTKMKFQTLAHGSPTENGEAVVFAELALENFSYLMEEVSRFPWNAIFREGLRCLDDSVLRCFDEQWRLQHIAEAKLLAKRAGLFQEQIKLVLDAVASSLQN